MEEITPSHKAFLKVTKALNTEGYITTFSLKKPDNSVALDDVLIVECLADSIESHCCHACPTHDIAHIQHIEEEVQNIASFEPKDDMPSVSFSEVQTLLKSLKTKASDLDGTSNKAIKSVSLSLLGLLVAIFNASLRNCYFPPVWKEAAVIGIHKPETLRPPCQLQTDQPPERSE
ncbi:Probable RNA-directed DNA polymerase from transposon BS [Eumeta japonica]|uniref:Probable RNA-directed DNA polymerase from transposon BS n=1 Tax=Eumeta variegata TaxID=151549 RepID=A0A4C1TZC8_EUMVA|nr:Probable RNA-directed DNA polymerase from transposon BS [Eumeta japonica]